ncbi:MAG TPA: alanine:cation symporter family protein [Oscillospiraceae bacterium]|nr:alanine:cation symporter family protein [Oscillospiraceae bacterium]HPK34760.1 alanine:cation symporter family protein [Oscillospiraceae bacterium]HPR76140.1 alanine:cation symporter family protein [Oscillospiraceae bacterium]
MMSVLQFLSEKIIWGIVPVCALLAVGLWLSVKNRFYNLTGLIHVPKILARQSGKKLSPFEVFSLTTGGKLGVGNIVGVSAAIATGGPGAVFWMGAFSILGSAISYEECRLGAKLGSPPAYMRKLGRRKTAYIFTGLMFLMQAVLMPAIQVNSAAVSLHENFMAPPTYFGAVTGAACAALFLACTLGGEKRLARISARILPPAAIAFMFLCIAIIAVNYQNIPQVFNTIFKGALGIEAVAGGGLGAAASVGVRRGAFSCEAGWGIAPYAAAKAEGTPEEIGLCQSLSVLFDTLFMCTLTGLALLCSGCTTAVGAAGTLLGKGGGLTVSLLVAVFAFTTILTCGFTAAANVSGIKRAIIFVFMAGVMICAGAAAPEVVWTLCDLAGGILCIINMSAVVKLKRLGSKPRNAESDAPICSNRKS